MKVRARLEVKPVDLWVGAFVRTGVEYVTVRDTPEELELAEGRKVDVWICVVPMLPIHLTATWLPQETLREVRAG